MADFIREYTVGEMIEDLQNYPLNAIIVVPGSFNTMYGAESWTDQVIVRGKYSTTERALLEGKEIDEVQIGSIPE